MRLGTYVRRVVEPRSVLVGHRRGVVPADGAPHGARQDVHRMCRIRPIWRLVTRSLPEPRIASLCGQRGPRPWTTGSRSTDTAWNCRGWSNTGRGGSTPASSTHGSATTASGGAGSAKIAACTAGTARPNCDPPPPTPTGETSPRGGRRPASAREIQRDAEVRRRWRDVAARDAMVRWLGARCEPAPAAAAGATTSTSAATVVAVRRSVRETGRRADREPEPPFHGRPDTPRSRDRAGRPDRRPPPTRSRS